MSQWMQVRRISTWQIVSTPQKLAAIVSFGLGHNHPSYIWQVFLSSIYIEGKVSEKINACPKAMLASYKARAENRGSLECWCQRALGHCGKAAVQRGAVMWSTEAGSFCHGRKGLDGCPGKSPQCGTRRWRLKPQLYLTHPRDLNELLVFHHPSLFSVRKRGITFPTLSISWAGQQNQMR